MQQASVYNMHLQETIIEIQLHGTIHDVMHQPANCQMPLKNHPP